MSELGKRIWFFPDGDLPDPGDGGKHGLHGHESLVILNPNPSAAHVAITRGNTVSAVTRNRSCLMVLASDLDNLNPSSGKIARISGSIQNVSGSSRASDMGNMPLA